MKWWTRRTRSLHSLAEEDGLSILNNINRISSGVTKNALTETKEKYVTEGGRHRMRLGSLG